MGRDHQHDENGQARRGRPLSVGERLHTRWDFVPVLENELADFVMPDVTWTGGISELKKIATMAEADYVPVSPHDASGPINLVAGAHVMSTTPEPGSGPGCSPGCTRR